MDFDDIGPNSTFSNLFFNYTIVTREYNNTEPLYVMPHSLTVFFVFVYIVIILIGSLGNSVTIFVILKSSRMKTVTNLYIANLALADLMVCLFAVPFQFYAIISQKWDLPPYLCDLCPAIVNLSVNVSVLTMTFIGLDRYMAVLKPLTHKPSFKKTKTTIACIWLVSGVIAAPITVFWQFEIVRMDNTTKPFCNVANDFVNIFQIYNVFLTVVDYILPMVIISSCYTRIALRLWGSKPPGVPCVIRDSVIIRNKKKIVRMLVVVVLLFSVCWLPYHIYFLTRHIINIDEFKYIQVLFICSHWLAMSNSCFNPIIYAIFCSKFRGEYLELFSAVISCKRCTGKRLFQNNIYWWLPLQRSTRSSTNRTDEIDLQDFGERVENVMDSEIK